MSLFRKNSLIVGLILLGLSTSVLADDLQDANILFKQGRNDQALAKVEKHLASNPSDAQARFLKGLVQTELNKIDAAIATFSALTEDFPELPEPYNNLAVLYASQNNFDKARSSLEMAIRTHPSYATAHENLGDIYAKLASKAYDRALQLDRSNNTTQTKLSLIKDIFDGGTRNNHKTNTSSAPNTNKSSNTTSSTNNENNNSGSALDARGQEAWAEIERWAAAWSARDAEAYLSFYASSFIVPDGQNRDAWEASRKDRITSPKFIEVKVSQPRVLSADGSSVTIRFKQSYNASHYRTNGYKTLKMVNSGGNWQIQEERSN